MEFARIVSMSSSTEQLVERLVAWAKENPTAEEYCLGDELEARQLLVIIAAHLKVTLAGTESVGVEERNKVNGIMRDMRAACAQARAMEYIAELNITDQLEFIGLRIMTPEVTMQ